MSDKQIVGIRFRKVGKIYHFDATRVPDIAAGDFAIVETSRGRQIGQVIHILDDPQPSQKGKWKHIERKAEPRDLVLRQVWERKELEAAINCRVKVNELDIAGIKIVAAEYSLDGKRLTFLYSSEGEEKVDLSNVRKEMRKIYTRSSIEMRQVGPRDVAKIIGGMGACGMETRCCSKFLTEFSPISIRMAKEQGISLTPSEITGMCGRLRCCLIYEYELYVEARKTLPKRGKRVVTPLGEGKVTDSYPLTQNVVVEIEDIGQKEFHKDEIQPWDELEALRRKADNPCEKHANGDCDCTREDQIKKK